MTVVLAIVVVVGSLVAAVDFVVVIVDSVVAVVVCSHFSVSNVISDSG